MHYTDRKIVLKQWVRGIILLKFFKSNKKNSLSVYLLLVMIFAALVNAGSASAQTTVLSQPPNQAIGYFSDPDCNVCASGASSAAENFVLNSFETIAQIKIWGAYVFGNVPLVNDNFTVIFHNDSGGLPGSIAAPAETGVPSTRIDSGFDIAGFDEYEFTLTLANPVMLGAGTYWVEIFNDTTGSTENFAWDGGTLDPVNGISGTANDNLNAPGSIWNPGGVDVGIEIITAPPVPAPAMNKWGILIFMVLAGAGAIYHLLARLDQAKRSAGLPTERINFNLHRK